MIDRLLFRIPFIRKVLTTCALFALICGLLIIGQAFCLTSALTNMWYNQALVDQVGYLVGFFCCFVARQILDNIQTRYLDSFATKRADEYRTALSDTLFTQGKTLVQNKGTGGLTTLMIEGVDQVEAYIRMMLPRITKLIIVPLMLLFLIVSQDWVSALIGLLVFPAIILQMVLIGHTASIEAGKQHHEYQRLANHFLDSVRGIDTLKFFGRSTDQAKRIFESSERFRQATMKTLRIATLSGAVLDAFSTISLAAIAVMLGFRLVDGSLTLFPALFVLVLMPDYFKPIREFASDYHASLDGKNSLHSILELIDNADKASSHTTDQQLKDAAFSKVLPSSFSFKAEGLCFSYPTHNTLTQVSFSCTTPNIIGIVGSSGSGKSTLAHLLAGVTSPHTGSFTIDKKEVPTLADRSWQNHVAYIPQNPHIFHASLRDNVTFYQPDSSEKDIRSICALMGLDSLIEDLPQGLDTIIGEGAHALSGGQAQRIAFARAFLHHNCRVLVLDEPTAHLDIETELELKTHMLELMQDKLVFFATHRLHWLSAMNEILFLDHGNVVAYGDYETIRSNKTFNAFISQAGGGNVA